MWRWLHSLPRTLRGHFHGQSASVGVCVDDRHDGADASGRSEKEQPGDWKEHCKYREKKKDEKRRPEKNFWRMVHGPCPSVEAIGLGGAIALGIQLGHFKCLHRKLRKPQEERKHCLLYQVAYALPALNDPSFRGRTYVTHAGARPKDTQSSKKVKDSETIQEPEITLDEAFSKFVDLCNKYEATGKGIMGNQAAHAGKMKEATKLWSESSVMGHAVAQYNMAVSYETGRGVTKDLDQAVQYYRLAAEGNHSKAMYNLANLYLEGGAGPQGRAGTHLDRAEAVQLLTKSADMGCVLAQRYLGVLYTEEGQEDVTKALNYVTMAAEQGDVESQYNLALFYENGYGVEENTCRAASLYSQAAEGGHVEALYCLAQYHQQGLGGLPQDNHSASRLYKMAADRGHKESQSEYNKLQTRRESTSRSGSPPDSDHTSIVPYLMTLNSSMSSPCLTDYLRSNMVQVGQGLYYDPVSREGTVSPIYSQLMTPRGFTQLPSFTRLEEDHTEDNTMSRTQRKNSDSDSGVVFMVGSEDEAGNESDLFSGYGVTGRGVDSEVLTHGGSRTCHTLQRRNSTMPELHCIPCV